LPSGKYEDSLPSTPHLLAAQSLACQVLLIQVCISDKNCFKAFRKQLGIVYIVILGRPAAGSRNRVCVQPPKTWYSHTGFRNTSMLRNQF